MYVLYGHSLYGRFLLQVIGWRPNARHLLIYITDAGFHHAADGYVSVWLALGGTVCVCV